MNKLLLLGIVMLGMMVSCSTSDTRTRSYKAITKTNVNMVITSKEPLNNTYIYNVGDTVMIDADKEVGKGRTRVVIIAYL